MAVCLIFFLGSKKRPVFPNMQQFLFFSLPLSQFAMKVMSTPLTSLLDSWYQGCFPYVKISQRTTPKLQMSLSVVNFLYMMLSGGIQRIGSMVRPPT